MQVLGNQVAYVSTSPYAHILVVIGPALQRSFLVATNQPFDDDTLIIGAYASSVFLVSCLIFVRTRKQK